MAAGDSARPARASILTDASCRLKEAFTTAKSGSRSSTAPYLEGSPAAHQESRATVDDVYVAGAGGVTGLRIRRASHGARREQYHTRRSGARRAYMERILVSMLW
eukprot:scaffold1983_cov376-Prasinococcus_capsulatus_cf.AAC.15